MRRQMVAERMDEPGVPRRELAEALRFIRGVNRRLGGSAALVRHLAQWSAGWTSGTTVELLDVATGSADIPVAAVRWARGRGIDLRVTGVDIHETTLELAREHVEANPDVRDAIRLVREDAFELESGFGRGAFDYAHAGMFLHHLEDGDCVRVLRQMSEVSRRGLVWNDLVRSRIAEAGIRVLTLGAPAMVRHDAVVSVRKGFTRAEVLSLARAAGVEYGRYRSSLWTQRFTLAGEKAGSEQE